MQDNYEKLRSQFKLIQPVNLPTRPYQITANFDGSTILVFTVDSNLHQFQRNKNKWDLILSQKWHDQMITVQINQKGTNLAYVSRGLDYFWIAYLTFHKKKWILKNKFKLKQDPDPYITNHDFRISKNLQLCTYRFQWNRNYQRINAFQITSHFKRIQRQKFKGSEITFSNDSNFFVVQSLEKLELKVFYKFSFNFVLFQTQVVINSYIIESNTSILIHTTELVLWNFQTNKKIKIQTPYNMFQEMQSHQMIIIGNLLLVQFNDEIIVFQLLQQKLKYCTTCNQGVNDSKLISCDRQIMVENTNIQKIEISQI
ncbi:unnamed protein product (macronuclear) [Paramecium tetraurelia]|uniref:Transmembrane protein n=1 Tax=Paramecium tetraurelia TaxID=5888 RepID=A0CHP6_PARTE|nr:uncharacterized protein GSPATT00038415001 [Paramecium tetraurelia]CAK70313.1 unnamed protein product [Paramecium tetraurelia]|eukprot:XP_001437710.1 hypothetical protein (macronuclear) [Paramecium tetraurelia strain d4-2]